MDIVYKLLLWVHLMALAMGGAATFGHPVLGAIGASTPEARPHLMRVGRVITMIGRSAIVLLVLTGLAMMWLVHDWGAMSVAFWLKLLVVVALIANVIAAGLLAKRAAAGDVAAAARLPVLSKIGIGLLLLIVLFAVLTFS